MKKLKNYSINGKDDFYSELERDYIDKDGNRISIVSLLDSETNSKWITITFVNEVTKDVEKYKGALNETMYYSFHLDAGLYIAQHKPLENS